MKYKFRYPWKFFIIIFLATQIIGYGFNIDFLKIYTIINDGIRYSLASTIIPILLAFLFDYLYQLYCFKKDN